VFGHEDTNSKSYLWDLFGFVARHIFSELHGLLRLPFSHHTAFGLSSDEQAYLQDLFGSQRHSGHF